MHTLGEIVEPFDELHPGLVVEAVDVGRVAEPREGFDEQPQHPHAVVTEAAGRIGEPDIEERLRFRRARGGARTSGRHHATAFARRALLSSASTSL